MPFRLRQLASATCALAILSGAASARAQARLTAADLQGVITDQTGGRLPGATVTATSLATNIARSTPADEEGRYVILSLPPGDYRVDVELSGFKTLARDVRAQIGELVEADFELQLARIEQAVVVPAAATVVNPSQTTISSVIARNQIDSLPINGRRFVSFAALTPGVTRAGSVEAGSETSGLSFIGQRPVSNNLLVDGLDNNDRILGGANVSFGQESVREFQVITGSYPAEFGNATGGIVNIVTKSGSNLTAGSAFAYYRNDALNARDHFERVDPFGTTLTQEKAPFEQTQFGASAGAPLRRDRTFFFTSIERTDLTASNFVTIDQTVAAVLTASGFPVETGHVPYDQSVTEFVAKVDHYWRPAANLSVRVNVSDVMNGNYVPFGGLVARSASAREDRTTWGLAASQTDVIGNRWVNEARAQFSRQDHLGTPADAAGPAVTLAGLASAGRSEFHPTDRRNLSLQLKDTVTRADARHTFKAGVDVTVIDQDALVTYNFGGGYTFVPLPPIPGLLPAPLSALGAFIAGLPALYVQGYGDGTSLFTYREVAGFVQDDWRATSRLTLKGGLRYQLQDYPAFDVTVSTLGGATLTYPFPLGGHNLAPRVAAAFDPRGDGRASIHAAYGLFFGNQLTTIFGATNVFGRDDGTRLNVLQFPFTLAAWAMPQHRLPEPSPRLPRVTITVGPDARTPRVHQTSVGVTRDLGRLGAFAADFVYARGSHQLGALDYNPIVPALGPGRRPNDVAGIPGTSASAAQYTDFGETWYRGLLVSFQKRFSDRHEVRVAYTASRAEDNSAQYSGLVNDNGRGRSPSDPRGLPVGFDPGSEKGPANVDQPHRLVFSGAALIPAGIQVSGLITAASGLPFTPLAGLDMNGDGIPLADRARTNPADPATAVARNSERLPAELTVDLRVARAIRLGQRATLTPLVEVFNLFDRANFVEVNNVFGPGVYPSDPQRDALGRVTYGLFQKARAPRQVQLAARVSF